MQPFVSGVCRGCKALLSRGAEERRFRGKSISWECGNALILSKINPETKLLTPWFPRRRRLGERWSLHKALVLSKVVSVEGIEHLPESHDSDALLDFPRFAEPQVCTVE
jgi:hypothetical protein